MFDTLSISGKNTRASEKNARRAWKPESKADAPPLSLFGGFFASTARHCSLFWAVVCGGPRARRLPLAGFQPAHHRPFCVLEA